MFMSWRDWVLSLLLPGLGHAARGWWRRAFLFFVFLAVQGGILFLAVAHGRLAWLAGPSKYWFSTTTLFLLFLVLWAVAILDLRRLIRVQLHPSYAHGYWQIVGRRLARDAKGLVGLALILTTVYVALFAPFLAKSDAVHMELLKMLSRPSAEHPLGMDNFGRDVLDRVIFGTRVSLGIGAVATLITMLFGGGLGLLSGYFRGAADAIIMRFLEMINSIPFLVLVLLVVSLWGGSIPVLIIVLGIFDLVPARIIRSEVLSVREHDYVTAARALGAPTRRILVRHVLPNAIASLLVVTTMTIGVNIIVVAGLSFLGFGVRPPTPDWGSMLQGAQEFMRTAWWMAVYPGLAIVVTVFGFNILGDSLRDVLDPRLK
jgi:peptide/nickel transport system permease protein